MHRDYDAVLPGMEITRMPTISRAAPPRPTSNSGCWCRASPITPFTCWTTPGGCQAGTPAPSASRATAPTRSIGRHFSQFYAPEDRARGPPEPALATARRDGRFEGEGWRLRKDGSRFWAVVTITRCATTLASWWDSPRSRATYARHVEREREQLFAATFDNAPNGIAVADASGGYLSANARFQRLVGYSEAELRAKTIFDLTHPEDVAESRRAFQAS